MKPAIARIWHGIFNAPPRDAHVSDAQIEPAPVEPVQEDSSSSSSSEEEGEDSKKIIEPLPPVLPQPEALPQLEAQPEGLPEPLPQPEAQPRPTTYELWTDPEWATIQDPQIEARRPQNYRCSGVVLLGQQDAPLLKLELELGALDIDHDLSGATIALETYLNNSRKRSSVVDIPLSSNAMLMDAKVTIALEQHNFDTVRVNIKGGELRQTFRLKPQPST